MMFLFVSPFHNTFLITCSREVWWHSMAHVRRNSGTCQKNFVLVRDSVVGIATGYRLEGPGIESQLEATFSAPLQTGPGIHPASCRMITESFPGIKRPGRGVDHPPPLSTEIEEKEGLYFYSPSRPSWTFIG